MVFGADQPFPPARGSFQVPVAAPDSDPDEGDQVTVCFSAAWLPFVIGALQQLTLQATWQGDTATIQAAQDRAQLLIAMFGGDVGGCTGTVCIKGVIYDADCDCIKQTLDGGETYFENPGADPRHNAAYQFPPVEADDPACQAAANLVRYYSDLIDQVVLVVDEAGTAEGLMAIILPFVVELGPFGILIELVLGVAFVLFSAGATAISAAFTSDVYDQLLCIFDCNLEADGRCTAEDLAAIKTAIDTDIGGLVATVLDGMFLLQGEVGVSNAATLGDAPADCSSCDCCPPEYKTCLDLTTSDYGISLSLGTWVDGVGFVAGDTSDGVHFYRGVWFSFAILSGNVKKITVEFTGSAGSFATSLTDRIWYNTDTGGNWLQSGTSLVSSPFVYTGNLDGATVLGATLTCGFSNPASGSLTVTQIIVEGDGCSVVVGGVDCL